MIVKITNERKFTWYCNKLGWTYDVKPCLVYGVLSHYVTLETEKTSWPLYLNKEDCEVIYNNHKF